MRNEEYKEHEDRLRKKANLAAAKKFVEGLVYVSSTQGQDDWAVDGLTLLCEAFSDMGNMGSVIDFSSELQHTIFSQSRNYDEAARRWKDDILRRERWKNDLEGE